MAAPIPDHTACAARWPQIAALSRDQLDPADKAGVLSHLVDCEACAGMLTSLLTARLEAGDEPIETPASLAPRHLYDRYLDAKRPADTPKTKL